MQPCGNGPQQAATTSWEQNDLSRYEPTIKDLIQAFM